MKRRICRFDGNLGIDLLRCFVVFLDYTRERIVLARGDDPCDRRPVSMPVDRTH